MEYITVTAPAALSNLLEAIAVWDSVLERYVAKPDSTRAVSESTIAVPSPPSPYTTRPGYLSPVADDDIEAPSSSPLGKRKHPSEDDDTAQDASNAKHLRAEKDAEEHNECEAVHQTGVE